MNALAVAPVLVPLVTALACLAALRRPRLQAISSGVGAAAFLAVAVALVVLTARGEVVTTQLGEWPWPYGVRLRIDRVGAALLAVSALVLGAVLLTPRRGDAGSAASKLVLPLVHALMMGVGGAFATADLFNLYVWYEVMLVAALGLIAAGRERRHLDAALRYLVVNVIATAVLLAAVGGLYGVGGALDFAATRDGLDAASPAAATALVALLVAGLLIKAGAFPFFMWLPGAYPALPAPLLALFAGLLTKVGCYAVLRVVAEIAPVAVTPMLGAIGWLAAGTMVVGVLGAMHHQDLRRLLSFHVVSQVGYILLAVSLGTRAGFAAALVYTVHHVVVKANLFLVAGLMRRAGGSFDLRELGGLSQRPWLAAAFAVPAISLVGLPLSSGFWAKLVVVRACFEADRHLFGALALLVGGLTLYSMTKVWIEAFWKTEPLPLPHGRRLSTRAAFATAALTAVTLTLGFAPEPLLDFAEQAAGALVAGGAP